MSGDKRLFPGKLAIQQRVLPAYRAPFFDALAKACQGGLSVFAGQPLPQEQIASASQLQVAQVTSAHNRHFFNPSSPFYQCWQAGLVEWLEAWGPEVLVVEANPRYRSTPRAVRWMHSRRRPVLGWGLGAQALSSPLASWRQAGRRSFLLSLDGVIAYSQRGAEEYRQLGFPAEHVFVAPNAASPRPTVPPAQRATGFQGRPRLLFVGRLQGRKRLDILLRACAALPEALQPDLWIVGDGPAREEFETLAQSLYPRGEFVGARYGAELERYFTGADLFVLPGTGGLAVQQAMAHGLPVIVAEGDGTQDDLVRTGNGWQIPPDDWQALAETLQAALTDPVRLRQMGAESYRIVAEEANLEVMVAAFVEAASAALHQYAG